MIAILAALLHDIGKFYQRTGYKIDLTKYMQYLVKRNNKYYYWHSAYTASFIDNYISQNQELIDLSASHHLQKESIVKRADIIAAAHDRHDSEYDDNEDLDFITEKLHSIFDVEKIIPLVALEEYQYPVSHLIDNVSIARKEYRSLFDKFVTSLKLIPKDLSILHHYLYPRLYNYTSTIPSNTYRTKNPTISLFEHLKLTCAICNCLKVSNDFIIITYRLKNISEYIYQDFNNLKVRSLLVQLVQDYLGYFIVNYFHLSYENILYSLAGQGHILLPKVKINELQKLATEITNLVNLIFDGIIQVVLSYDIYDENKLIYDYLQNEQKLKIKKAKNQHNIYINYSLLNSILKNDQFIIEYNFTKSNNPNLLKIDDVYAINLYKRVNQDSYYQSYNIFELGEVKFYPILNTLHNYENLVFVIMKAKPQKIVNSKTISIFNTLSNSLELFFGREVIKICKEIDNILLIYSGALDITFITSRNNCNILIPKIIDSFNKFTLRAFAISYQIEEFINEPINKVYCKAKAKLKEVSNNE